MAKLKVLSIDDDKSTVRLNESLLTSKGFDFISASDGNEGLLKAQSEKPDVILLDLILPGMYGFEVCKQLKEDPRTKQIPVIIVTGSGLEEVAKDEPDINAQGVISKPYSVDELISAINQALGKKT